MSQPVIAFGADALLAALLAPSNAAGRLLQYAPLGIYQAVVAPAELARAEQWGREGVGGRVVSEAELLAFRAAIGELLATEDEAPGGATRCGVDGTLPEVLLASLLAEAPASP
jgi:hypothetical protein